jgi:hypothetical protein
MNASLPLTGDQLATLQRGEALHFSTPDPAQNVVVLLASQYQQLKQFAVTDEPVSSEEVYSLLRDVNPEDWADLSEFPTARPI